MARTQTDESMPEEGRALLTETERAIIAGEQDATDNYRYKVKSLVRQRINKQGKLGEDVRVLAENMPELHEELQEVVCND